ncbi:phosphotransferase enzyme family protein [Cordyceps fumosorosea ARSEF 2679]|uniref:Phosphotransferase enzyme family protein n=1 Tax=Cordyceps fumosorosea (strain ARSEF 2679) TaxID=1081104 RepID=A0A167NDR3_CORFA|nr:phosphotransferase enzyme family protein [Cordyceps fumosorosea ARSEF 2679]OAA55442.1 phosphotransferase enzyme family protein [Cordyceps fumosorosea ARSEF 2679]
MVSAVPLSIPPVAPPAILPAASPGASPLQYDILFQDPDLPEPLPSLEAIESAQFISEKVSRNVVSATACFAVKFGYEVQPLEAENMRFVRENTNVRVPRVFAVYQRDRETELPKTYIVMEKLAGDSLDKLWHGLDAAQKLDIVAQLKVAFASLRSLPHPGFFGSIDGTKLREFLFDDIDKPTPSVRSPFKTEDALIDGLLDRFLAEDPGRLRHKTAYYRLVLPKIFKGSGQPVFTHSDLQLKNIMLQPDGRVAMIDWDVAGWYPAYWEYAVAICAHAMWPNDWPSHVGLFLDEYPNHFAWMNRLRMERW